MTVLVGILCEDGIVVGSDSSTTFAAGDVRTIEQSAQKTSVIGSEIIFAGTGQVGLGQRFESVLGKVRVQHKLDRMQHLAVGKQIAKDTIADFVETHCQVAQYGALVAFHCQDGFHLCEFAVRDFQPEFKTAANWFVSMGSGQPITDPFLALLARVFFGGSKPTLKEGVFAAAWALEHAIELNTGGIKGPSQIAVLARKTEGHGVHGRLLTNDEIAEHLDNVKGAEAHLASYRMILSGVSSASPTQTAPPPTPPEGGHA